MALLMVPTLCTQRGRAAFLAIVVALLLSGPINNIFINANEVSNSMSCSAEVGNQYICLPTQTFNSLEITYGPMGA